MSVATRVWSGKPAPGIRRATPVRYLIRLPDLRRETVIRYYPAPGSDAVSGAEMIGLMARRRRVPRRVADRWIAEGYAVHKGGPYVVAPVVKVGRIRLTSIEAIEEMERAIDAIRIACKENADHEHDRQRFAALARRQRRILRVPCQQ